MQDDLTAREQLIMGLSDDGASDTSLPSEEPAGFIVETKNDDQKTLMLPDGQRHESRTTSVIQGPHDKVFWVNLLVACNGPQVESRAEETGGLVVRDFGKLEYAKNDLEALYSYYRPIRLGSPQVVFPFRVGRSPGFFDKTVRLDDPRDEDLRSAVDELTRWIHVNRADPEYRSVQLNFMFAGHGYVGESRSSSGIVIGDGDFSSHDLARLIAVALAESQAEDGVPRVDLFLDCCHSGAVALDVTESLVEIQREEGWRYRLGRIFCSCLDDESSFEFYELPHGIFTFAYLNENSRKRPEEVDPYNIALRDIGWITEKEQHPFLLDFVSREDGSRFRFPSAKYIDQDIVGSVFQDARNAALQEIVNESRAHIGEDGVPAVLPVEHAVKMCRRIRAEMDGIETEIFADRSKQSEFFRTELRNQSWPWA